MLADPRGEMVRQARSHPQVKAIGESDVWDERSDDRENPRDQ